MKSEKSLIDLCLGSPAKIRILSTLAAWKGRDLAERQLSELCRISGFGVRHALGDLERSGIVTKRTVGRANVWSFNEASYAFVQIHPIIEALRKISSPAEDVKNRILALVRNDKAVDKIILFGSVVRSPFQKIGDIDVAVILRTNLSSPERSKKRIEESLEEISAVIGLHFGKRLEPRVFSAQEWEGIRRKPLGVNILEGKEIYPREET